MNRPRHRTGRRLAFLLPLFFLFQIQTGKAGPARELIQQALEAMGGADGVGALHYIHLEGLGHTFLLEQSERPEGPWIPFYHRLAQTADLKEGRLLEKTETRYTASDRWQGSPWLADGQAAAVEQQGHWRPGRPSQLEQARERLELGPERILLTALSAKDLREAADTSLQRVNQNVLKFTWNGGKVTLYLNAYTHLPTAVDLVRAYPDDNFLGVWGDLTKRTLYSFWVMTPGGIMFPKQWDTELNGQPHTASFFSVVDLDFSPPPNLLDIPAEVQLQYRKAAGTRPTRRTIQPGQAFRPGRKVERPAPGVLDLPGWWDVVLVRQSDGVVVIEAPLSSEFSSKVMARAHKEFPGLPIKAVISTTDAWPHIGGVRQYVARGIPIYALDLNLSIISRVIDAPFRSFPDDLARAPQTPKLHAVKGKTAIGSGPNRLQIYPVQGEAGERMLMVYFPEHQLLYGGDALQQGPDGSFYMPRFPAGLEYASELVNAARREGLSVKTAFSIHTSPVPWSRILDDVRRMKEGRLKPEKP